MASCAVSVGRAVQQHGALPFTAALAGAQAAAHFKTGGYQLLKVGGWAWLLSLRVGAAAAML